MEVQGADIIYAGVGADLLIGESGNDTFMNLL